MVSGGMTGRTGKAGAEVASKGSEGAGVGDGDRATSGSGRF